MNMKELNSLPLTLYTLDFAPLDIHNISSFALLFQVRRLSDVDELEQNVFRHFCFQIQKLLIKMILSRGWIETIEFKYLYFEL